jgi:HK97 family phage major capsid protein
VEVKDLAAKIDGISDTVKAVKDEINANVDSKIKELDSEITKAKSLSQSIESKVIALEQKAATQGMGNQPQVAKSFESELGEKLNAQANHLKSWKNGETRKGFQLDLQAKAVGNMSSSGSLTGSYFVSPHAIPGVVQKPYESLHVRDILPVGTTTSNTCRYVVDNGGEGGPGMTAEGGSKPQIDRDLEIKDSNVKKIATHFRIPEEMIDDIPYLQSFLSSIGVEEVMALEDTQLLFGDGTGQNINGLATTATAFAAGTSVIGASANHFDVIRAAKKQLRNAKYSPSVAFVSPTDWFDMTSKKDSTNNYLFQGGGNGISFGVNIDGIRVVEHTAVTAGSFIVGDPRTAQIFDRMGTTVRFFDQDQDNAIKNLITVVIEKRLALVNYRPAAWVTGTFADAITDLTS